MRKFNILCLSFVISGAAAAAGNVQLDISLSAGDTIWYDHCYSLDIKIASDVALGGFQIPITITSTGGTTWTFNGQYTNAWGHGRYVTHVVGTRMGDPAATFDLTGGIVVNETYLPQKLYLRGAVMISPGVPAGPLSICFRSIFRPTTRTRWAWGRFASMSLKRSAR